MQNDRNLARRAERTGSVLVVGLLVLLIVGMLYWRNEDARACVPDKAEQGQLSLF